MEELKLLIEAVAGLPTLTLWVLLGYLIYKLAVIGSVYGVVRFGIEKIHDWLTSRHKVKDVRPMIDRVCITGCADQLITLIQSLANVSTRAKTGYVHSSDVEWLEAAVREKKVRELEQATK
jgi:hypothetical protein